MKLNQDRLRALQDSTIRDYGVLTSLKEERNRLLSKIKEARDKESLLAVAEGALSSLISQATSLSTVKLNSLVTEGIRYVFDDMDLIFESSVVRSRGKTAVKFELFENGKSVPILSSYGGGVVVVISVLLRILVIMALKLRRVLLLDESLSHLSVQYVPKASSLLKVLARDLGFEIVMVTHSEEMASKADIVLEASSFKNVLQLRQL